MIDRHGWQDMCADSGYTEVDVPVNILVYTGTNVSIYKYQSINTDIKINTQKGANICMCPG